ncbi:MAG: hypothetical protein F6K30_16740 [Cyanothece sp. SIO2G6]|nr:hypothetical protein [Cyanothece sp. SIO2G6]
MTVIINEVFYDPASGLSGDANGDGTRDVFGDEFIEIVNTGNSPVDLSGWTLGDDDGSPFTFPDGTILAVNQAAVLFGGGTPSGTFGNALVFTDDGRIGNGLSNSGDLVELRDSDGQLIDSVGYGGAGAVSGGSGQSVTRDADLVGSFANHSTATGSGGTLFSPGTKINGSAFCFLQGTHILSDRGEVLVENLQVGDNILTFAGKPEPIKWIGIQTIDPKNVTNALRGYPIQIKAGALGNEIPHRDLYVSPDHAIFWDGLLINAGALVNDISIVTTTPQTVFVYYHIELQQHSLVVAEGAATESYLPENGDRSVFDNGAEYEALYPHNNILAYWPMKYPRVNCKRQLPRFVGKQLMAIAKTLVRPEVTA